MLAFSIFDSWMLAQPRIRDHGALCHSLTTIFFLDTLVMHPTTEAPNIGASSSETQIKSPTFGIQRYDLEEQEPLFILDTTLNFTVRANRAL
jgi:hypothetical protein